MTIGTGVSENRLVVSVADDQAGFIASQAKATGMSRSHIVRQALAHYQRHVERVDAIEASVRANEGPY